MIVLVLIGFGIAALIQVPGLVRKKWWRELIGFVVLWSIGLILSLMMSVGIKIPPVSSVITQFITGMFGM